MRDVIAVGATLVLVVALGVVPAAASAGIGAGVDGGPATVAVAGGGAPANAQAACSYPLTVTDATGTEVTVEAAPQRIVTLAPSAAQTLWAFNASDTVVGVSDNAGYLEGASEKEVVTDRTTIKTEVVVGLEPDLVLAPDIIPDEKVEQLRSAGLTVYNTNSSTNFEDVYAKTERIGALTGECAAANATVTDMRERVTAIRNAVADEGPVGGLYVFYGYTTGEGTFIDSILTTAGLTNVAAEAGISGFGQLSEEVVANNSEDIEWLVLNDNPASHPTSDVYNETYAMQNDQVVVLDVNYLNQPGPRTVWALENLTKAVYPDAYAEAQAALEATPTPSPTATPTATASATEASESMATPTATPESMATATPDSTPTPSTGASGPGFTATVGVLAVLVATLFARRRR